MPDVKDAIEVVTDPKNIIFSDSRTIEHTVNAKRALAALRKRGASKAEARLLITEAVTQLDGHVGAEVRVGGRGAGPDTRTASETWAVPVAAIRKPS
jgi:hypothetical protein